MGELRRADERRRPSFALAARHLLSRRQHRLRTHTSPDQIRAMQQRTPPIYMVSPGRCYRRDTPDATHSPIFLQVECLAVDRGITLADLQGTVLQFFRALFGQEREVRMRTSFFPFTEPSVEFDVTCFICGGAGCATCKHSGWIEMGGAGWVDPDVFRNVDLDPTSGKGSRSGSGSSGSPCSGTACPTCARSGRTTSASWGSSDESPGLLAARVRRLRPAASRSSRAQLVFTSCEVDRIVRHGVPGGDNLQLLRRRQGARGRQASERRQAAADEGRRRRGRAALDRLRRLELRRRCDGRRRAPGGVMPGGEFTIEKRKLRGEVSDGMILSERELELGQDHGGIMVLSDELAAGHAACRGAAARRRHARDRDALQPARPDVGLRDRP